MTLFGTISAQFCILKNEISHFMQIKANRVIVFGDCIIKFVRYRVDLSLIPFRLSQLNQFVIDVK